MFYCGVPKNNKNWKIELRDFYYLRKEKPNVDSLKLMQKYKSVNNFIFHSFVIHRKRSMLTGMW